MTDEVEDEVAEDIKITRLLGTERKEFMLACGKKIILKPATMKDIGDFQKKFGQKRLFLSNAHDGKSNQLEFGEQVWLLDRLMENSPWQTQDAMLEDMTMPDLMLVQHTLYSFFHGVTTGEDIFSDSSNGASSPEAGPN